MLKFKLKFFLCITAQNTFFFIFLTTLKYDSIDIINYDGGGARVGTCFKHSFKITGLLVAYLMHQYYSFDSEPPEVTDPDVIMDS